MGWPGITDPAGRRHHCEAYSINQICDAVRRRRRKLTLNVSELTTTDTLENAIAAAAIIGCRCKPHGKKKPIARGIMRTL
jgi:hypothetical protein